MNKKNALDSADSGSNKLDYIRENLMKSVSLLHQNVNLMIY